MFAYDVNKFPADDAAVSIGIDGYVSASSWSPNGHSLLYSGGSNLYVRDMSGAAPGDAVLLVSGLGTPSNHLLQRLFSWSPDGKSVVALRGVQLVAFDPSSAAPPLHVVTSSAKNYVWAPSGTKLLYTDATGAYVVDVTSGNIGAPRMVGPTNDDLDSSSYTWSQDATRLAHGSAVETSVTLIDLRVPSPTSQQVATLSAPGPILTGFNADGSVLAFIAKADRAQADLFYVALTDPPGAPVKVTTNLLATDNTTLAIFHPKLPLLVYTTGPTAPFRQTSYVLPFSGQAAGNITELPGLVLAPVEWVPGSSSILARGKGAVGLLAIDLAGPPDPPVQFLEVDGGSGVDAFHAAPSGSTVAFQQGRSIGVASMRDPSQRSITSVIGVNDTFGPWQWSPDSKFLAVLNFQDNAILMVKYQVFLMRVNGTTTSAPIPLKPAVSFGTNGIRFAWQPGG
jgi:hypothetical protein